ncbi:hypothetical protein KPH14_010365 [Odynerus spinipes]|uniref:Uncharacterized protein n=1 Tax=Odynerus spinipes TaxID=1348599 RepID=A0AAD9RV31_9HYME|nr:hypothetical protein KPH14_010365 [Odynerus spinipes]
MDRNPKKNSGKGNAVGISGIRPKREASLGWTDLSDVSWYVTKLDEVWRQYTLTDLCGLSRYLISPSGHRRYATNESPGTPNS